MGVAIGSGTPDWSKNVVRSAKISAAGFARMGAAGITIQGDGAQVRVTVGGVELSGTGTGWTGNVGL